MARPYYPQNMGDNEGNYRVTQGFQSFVSKPDLTALDPRYLVKGSSNVLVDYANRIVSRNGYTLYNQASTGGGGTKGSYEWENSSGWQMSLRSYDHTLEFDYDGLYRPLISTLRSPYIEFAKVLDYTEQMDVLLFVNGDGAQMHKWSGGVSKVRSSTATTLTKAGVLTATTTIAFVAGDGVLVNPTITDSGNRFLEAQFAAGDTLHIAGSVSNNSNFTIASVTAGTITLIMSDVLYNEAAGATVTMFNQTGPTWKAARFLSAASTPSLVYNGTVYAYSGGESTDTLTGLSAFPTVTAGDIVWQNPSIITLPSAITSADASFYPDLIGVQLNMVFLASTKSSFVFGSKGNDYTNFTLTTPRAQGDPMLQPLTSGPCKCIVPVDSTEQILNVQNTLLFGSGLDTFDKIDFHMSADNTAELCRIIRLRTAKQGGVYSKSAICPIKNNTVYISNEPALEGLSQANLESPDGSRNVPISDAIKNDFDTYDFTDSHVMYWKRALYVSVPTQGIVLIYDLMRNRWQPPQYMPISRFAIFGGWLYGHSSITNETYKLFVGTNDNSAPIKQRARFAYNNAGNRTRLKSLSEYWSDGYITPNATLTMYQNFGFNASEGFKSMDIVGSDTSITVAPDANPLGSSPLGSLPLGGSSLDDAAGLPSSGATMLRFYQIDTMVRVVCVEQFVEYAMDSLDGQFAIVAHGSDMQDAGTADVVHKK